MHTTVSPLPQHCERVEVDPGPARGPDDDELDGPGARGGPGLLPRERPVLRGCGRREIRDLLPPHMGSDGSNSTSVSSTSMYGNVLPPGSVQTAAPRTGSRRPSNSPHAQVGADQGRNSKPSPTMA